MMPLTSGTPAKLSRPIFGVQSATNLFALTGQAAMQQRTLNTLNATLTAPKVM
jgi:molybdopterin biosynthesis enzyme MoaB